MMAKREETFFNYFFSETYKNDRGALLTKNTPMWLVVINRF